MPTRGLVVLVRLSACLSVCLSVRKFHKFSRMSQPIITKFVHKQALVPDSCKTDNKECTSNNLVMWSITKPNFAIAISPSILSVQRGNKYLQNLCLMGHYLITEESVYVSVWNIVSGRKSKLSIAMFKIPVCHTIASILMSIWKLDGKLYETIPFWPWLCHRWRHSMMTNPAFYIHV